MPSVREPDWLHSMCSLCRPIMHPHTKSQQNPTIHSWDILGELQPDNASQR